MTTGCFGLTISGFYYIALHRASGRIEGLYFDPGSQPFQELRLSIEGNGGWGVDVEKEAEAEVEMEMMRGEVGVKRWFPSVEFR
jgi:Vacuolar import and degradation protein